MVFVFQKIMGNFLEPPGIFVLVSLLVLAGLKKLGKYGLVSLTLLLYLCSTGLGVRLLGADAEIFAIPPQVKPEAIVILGGGTLFDQVTGEHTLHPISAMRLLQGYFLFQKEKLPLFVSGGTIWGKEPQSEGELMKEMLIRLGVPEEKIMVEKNARTTWENAQFITPLLRERSITTFYLVSSQAHLRRALWAFTHFYPQSLIIPVSAHPTHDRAPLGFEDFLPSLEALSASSAFFHEWWGLLFYRLKAKHNFMESAKRNTRFTP